MKIGRKALESACRELALRTIKPAIARMFGASVGFALVIFDFGEKGDMAYLSDCQREDMVKLVREWLALLEAGLTTEPPGPRAES